MRDQHSWAPVAGLLLHFSRFVLIIFLSLVRRAIQPRVLPVVVVVVSAWRGRFCTFPCTSFHKFSPCLSHSPTNIILFPSVVCFPLRLLRWNMKQIQSWLQHLPLSSRNQFDCRRCCCCRTTQLVLRRQSAHTAISSPFTGFAPALITSPSCILWRTGERERAARAQQRSLRRDLSRLCDACKHCVAGCAYVLSLSRFAVKSHHSLNQISAVFSNTARFPFSTFKISFSCSVRTPGACLSLAPELEMRA